MTRRPTFWIVFAALGVAGAVTALRLFTVALPVVSLEIEIGREAAIAEADSLAARYGWGPDDARSAASFGQADGEVQTYVELEGGGADAFQELMDAGAYHPYQWRVRRFAEGEVEEVEVRFTPAGAPYGFDLRLPEDDPGAGNLDDGAARALAEREAADAWGVELGAYELLEASDEALPGGRVDHTFVYQRDDVTRGDARFRLRLVVAGERLSELTHFAFVPEAFSQRYAQMRSTNEAIALVSQSVFLLFYVILGAGLGTALLLRAGWIEWRTAMAWGAVTAILFGLNTINALPLAWMGYDTALSAGTFILRNVAAAGAIALLGTPILAFFFLAGESLGRRAFPEHLRQWRFWSPEVAASRPALGITVAAYLLVGIQVGYVVLFYLGTSRLEGWWSPSDALVQPDLLATYLPWLQAVSTSLFASLWEESIFRAVPIACAALLGARYGRRDLWIWTAVVVQALVFAAGHANYPQQPPYARVVELTLPALVWGVVYVRYGLVPTILAHFLYDLSLISSVLFASEALVDQGVILLVGAVPLAVILWARRGGRAVDRAPEWAYNRAWTPAEDGLRVETAGGVERVGGPEKVGDAAGAGGPGEVDGLWGAEGEAAFDGAVEGTGGGAAGAAAAASPSAAGAGGRSAPSPFRVPRGTAAIAALVGVALWLASLVLAPPPPRLLLSRGEALEVASDELVRLGFELDGWTGSAVTGDGRVPAHEYVMQEAGPEAYESMLGEFLAPPQWIVRYVDWSAQPEERVEEIVVNVGPTGTIRRVAHTLPEGRAGARLAEDSARALVRAALPAGAWTEIGVVEERHDARTDWTFTFRSPAVLTDVAGEGRAQATVLGDEVTDIRRFVEVPEQWERDQREEDSRRAIVSIGLTFALVLLFGAGAVVAIVVWSRHGLDGAALWKAGALAFATLALSMANSWPSTMARFSTSLPLGFQQIAAAFAILIAIVAAAAIGLVVALAHSWAEPERSATRPGPLGVGLGMLVVGAAGLLQALLPGVPPLPDYSGAATFVPALAAPIDSVLPLLLATAALTALAAAHRRFADRPMLHSVTTFAILSLGVVVVPDALWAAVPLWVAGALTGAALVWILVRIVGDSPAVAPALLTTVAVAGHLESVLTRPFPGSVPGGLLAVAVMTAVGLTWVRELRS